MSIQFDVTCPSCGNNVGLLSDDSEGAVSEVSGQCGICHAEVVQDVEVSYSYDLKGTPQVINGAKKEYSFLYELHGKEKHRSYKATNIQQACDRMLAYIRRHDWLPREDCVVDYEAAIGNEFIDLYEIKHPIAEYLA